MNMVLKYLIVAISCILLGSYVVSCSTGSEPEQTLNERKPIVLSESSRGAVNQLNDFFVEFTTSAVKAEKDNLENTSENIVTSPLSASMLLAMLANTTDSQTAIEICKLLGVLDLEALNELASTILSSLPTLDNKTRLSLANSWWIDNKFSFQPKLKDLFMTDYNSAINLVDFSNTSSLLKEINSWGKKQTNGLIPQCIDQISPSSVAIVANALFFKSKWAYEKEFELASTISTSFFGTKGEQRVDMMMSDHRKRKYGLSDNFSATWIDFGNKAFSLMLILPNENISAEQANLLLNVEEMKDLRNNCDNCWVKVQLPKFRVSNKISLNPILEYAGLKSSSEGFKLSGLMPTAEGMLSLFQSISFEIDEKGAEAASVTTGGSAIAPPLPDVNKEYEMILNRPFYFFLTETSTGVCLISGRIANLLD